MKCKQCGRVFIQGTDSGRPYGECPACGSTPDWFEVRDTFNNGLISSHRTLKRAVESERRYVHGWKPYMGDCRVSVFDAEGDLGTPNHSRNYEYERLIDEQ